jgi:uncharacterized protein YjiS (DUF1127 family)
MTTLSLCRPWYRRLFDAAAERRAKSRRVTVGCDDLLMLDQHLLADIGLHPGQVESHVVEERGRRQALQLLWLSRF